MALLEGKKRWLLYPKEDAPLLYPVWPEGCHDPVFEADLNEPDAIRTPAALLAKGATCVLEAGAFRSLPGCLFCWNPNPNPILRILYVLSCPSFTLHLHATPELLSTQRE